MHILICTYEFDLGAEGICTGRLVRALLDAGCVITVVTSPLARTTFTHERLSYQVVPHHPLRPGKLFLRLAPLLGHLPTRFGYVWSRRVAGLKLEKRHDLVYGRSQPFQSVVAAHGLANRQRVPLWNHFSDPFPSVWLPKDSEHFKETINVVRRLMRDSQVLTFTTEQARAFQVKALDEGIEAKSFVLNHVAPVPGILKRQECSDSKVFAYFGMFYGLRNANALLGGFTRHLANHPLDRLLFVGTAAESVMPEAVRLGIERSISIVGRVDDVRSVMEKVDVLIATDAFSGPPLFLSTKLVEYLVVNRPVLLISPRQSPGAQLLERFPTTTTVVCSEEAAAIAAGLAECAVRLTDESDYRLRFREMERFNPSAVAETFIKQALLRNPTMSSGPQRS